MIAPDAPLVQVVQELRGVARGRFSLISMTSPKGPHDMNGCLRKRPKAKEGFFLPKTLTIVTLY